jgi:methyl-accepting chemotaxis protein
MGLFESKDSTIEKIKAGQIVLNEREPQQAKEVPPIIVNILNNNNPVVSTNISNQINIDIDIQLVQHASNELSGELNYLLSLLDEQNKVLVDTLKDLAEFATDARTVQNSGEMVSKGWKRKLKGLVEGLGKSGETIKNIKDGSEVLSEIYKGISALAKQFKWTDIQHLIDSINA